MDIRTPKILEKFDENFMDELERLEKLEQVRNRPGFKELIALMVVLTSSNNESPTWSGYYNRLCAIFTSVTCMRQTVESRSHFGRPLVRRMQPATSLLSGPLGRESFLSQYLWKLLDSVFMEVPNSYCHGFSAALLYLIVTEAGTSFRILSNDDNEAWEIPCLLEIFRHSSKNNVNCVCSLLGEYLSLLRVCRFENYSSEQHWYRCQTTTFDFSIEDGQGKPKYFSVKTIGRTGFSLGSCFACSATFRRSLDCETKFVHEDDEANVFIHDCCCQVCLHEPVRKICISREQGFLQELQAMDCRANQEIEKVLSAIYLEMVSNVDINKVEIYLVSGRIVYELRHALLNLRQDQFRGHKFKLREFLINSLRGNSPDSEQDTSERLRTLRVRTCDS
ncbi:hypothetical protein BOX15_Mlig029681g2 [Macrostomum lignano]|uniref:Uncharacterized protein n=1 Tax=Macrostomum lignano TaxID=282301 RepID=A0A267DHC9_9PLAT|nr:hypothetical protein BOX15_Mlig029681g2 [Macrostomum lignano]